MSQKSTPRSPKSPRSKSPSCEDVEGEQGEIFDELQRAVEEELRTSDRVLAEARNSIAGSKGRSAQSRASYQQSPSRHSSRIPSPRGASTCEEEEDAAPRLPSPPVSPVTYGSRGVTPGASQRTSRIPSPEHSGTKSYSASSCAQNEGLEEEYCEDDAEAYGSKYSSSPSQLRGTPTSRSTAPTSKIGSVTFGNKQSGVSYTSQMRYGNEMATSVAGLTSCRDANTSALRTNASNADAATSCLKMNASNADAATSCLKMNASNADAATSCLKMNPSNADARTNQSYSTTGTSCGRTCSSYTEAPTSRMGPSRVDMATSNMGMGVVDEGTITMSYKSSKERSSGFAGAVCSPGCRKFMDEIKEDQPLTSTPIRSTEQYQNFGSTFVYDKPPTPCPHVGGRRPGSPPPMAGQLMSPVQLPSHHHHHDHHAAPSFERSSPTLKSESLTTRLQQSGVGMHHHHFDDSFEQSSGRDETVVAALSHLSQLKKTPSYYRCGLSQGMDFLKVCCPKAKESSKKKPAKFPEIPCLRQEELEDLIKCETQDVDSAWYIMSDERKTYKKPCPKQQKAQMSVKALVQAHAGQVCSQKEYFPLEHPDPEDISPEVAAAMMFSQERGIKMEECPNDTITSLFPDEPKPPFPEKIPASSISIVDRSSKDQEELIEKSASVPSEGVSDSAYTRTMKVKGEDIGAQKSFDVEFAIGQSKREYILVAQKPQRVNKVQYRGNMPPWFPGFFSAFPDDDGIKIVTSPSGLFQRAWVHSNPGNMPASDVIVLD